MTARYIRAAETHEISASNHMVYVPKALDKKPSETTFEFQHAYLYFLRNFWDTVQTLMLTLTHSQ
jgi:hypothetical protein